MQMGTRLHLYVKTRKKRIGMANFKIREHHPNHKCRGPKQDAPLNLQKPEAPIDKYPSQTKTHQQWEAEMERLNTKYKLDCFSDSELDSESDEGGQYPYEHGYETLI